MCDSPQILETQYVPPLGDERILDSLPNGVALLDDSSLIRWCNRRFRAWAARPDVVGQNFYAVLGSPEILGPEFSPLGTALATGQQTTTKLRVGEKTYLQLHASPLSGAATLGRGLIVVVNDVTQEVQQRQKLEAIHQAGSKLNDLKPHAVCEMAVEDRIELLKSNILHYTQNLLNFQVVELRLLEERTGRLVPLLSEGLEPAAVERALFAQQLDNGINGFVAATGKSYLCEDTIQDPMYLPGLDGARSSLTVPLLLHDQVIGTFNVESPQPGAFSHDDLLLLEIFARDVAAALNTLELLAAQNKDTLHKSVAAIHRAVALPIDQILNDTVHVLEAYIGHEPDIRDRLKSTLRQARELKSLIHKVGHELTPADAVPATDADVGTPRRFQGVRVLVVDADESVLAAAHALLGRCGCTVETARSGAQAVVMVRSGTEDGYHVILADVRLPDMTGHQLQVQLQSLLGKVPLVLMQGFGYDPGHALVKACHEGLPPTAVLYKPFRHDQLLDVIETRLEGQDR